MRSSTPRVTPVVPGTDPGRAELEHRIARQRGRISPLYQVLLHSEPIASGWESMLTAVRKHTSIPADVRELVILRVAVLNRAGFEFEAHLPHAQAAGLDDALIRSTRDPGPVNHGTPLQLLSLRLTDAMTRDIEVPEELIDQLRALLDERGLVELCATVAAYNMVSRFLVAMNIVH